ncbi:MAG: GNAT family N-acetyltransferase [Pseudomonadota bacterium]|nr:GNAT family N-acetyltransferase [Pseudomonadota bacterium]
MTTIETSRLTLRRFEPTDIPDYSRIRGLAEAVRHLPGGEASTAHADEIAEQAVNRFIHHWEEHGFGPWAVCDKETGNLLGHCGLQQIDESGAAEIVILLDPSCWNKGLGSEILCSTLDYGFSVLGMDTLVAFVHPNNEHAQQLLEKVGMEAANELVASRGQRRKRYTLERETYVLE